MELRRERGSVSSTWFSDLPLRLYLSQAGSNLFMCNQEEWKIYKLPQEAAQGKRGYWKGQEHDLANCLFHFALCATIISFKSSFASSISYLTLLVSSQNFLGKHRLCGASFLLQDLREST